MKEVTVFVCSFCKESFDTSDGITCHLLNFHNRNTTVKKLREQLKIKKNESSKSKDTSKITRKTEPKVSQENKYRKYKTEFYCDLCDYKTVYLSTYKRHLLIHEKGGRQHKCSYCSYAAVQPNNLKIHVKTVHPFGAVDPVIIENS